MKWLLLPFPLLLPLLLLLLLIVCQLTGAQHVEWNVAQQEQDFVTASGASYGPSDYKFWRGEQSFIDWRRQCDKLNVSLVNGPTSIQTRIIGGQLAAPNMFPYQVGLLLLRAPNVYQCGGVLISKHFVLTAAHCIMNSSLGKVYLGSLDYANASSAAAVYNVTWRDFYPHERYVLNTPSDDIGLVYLAKAAPISVAVQVIKLAPRFMRQSLLEGEIVTLSGWGATKDNQKDTNLRLYYVDAPVMSQQSCACFYTPGLVRSREHICTDGSGTIGTCDGDSGGPLTFYYKRVHYLVGLTAFGSAGGCEIGYPSVYTRITNYLSWIARNTGLKFD